MTLGFVFTLFLLIYRYSDEYGRKTQVISRHTIVCLAAQEAGAPHRGYIDRKTSRKKENVIFTPLHLGDHYPIGTKFAAELPAS